MDARDYRRAKWREPGLFGLDGAGLGELQEQPEMYEFLLNRGAIPMR